MALVRLAFGSILAATLVVPSAHANDPLCGIDSVYCAALLLGRQPDYAALLKPEFVSSKAGSSIKDLERAALSLGLNSLALTNFTVTDLRWLSHPAILRVKSRLSAPDYDHFVLFGGFRDGKLIIYDGRQPPCLLTFGEIANRWDGSALVIARLPISESLITSPSRWRYWSCALSVTAVAIGWIMVRGRPTESTTSRKVTLSFIQCICILALALGAGYCFHAVSVDGFILNPEAVRGVRAVYAAENLSTIDIIEAQAIVREAIAVFVDARNFESFAIGHIPNAINIPATASDALISKLISRLPRERTVIVYCDNVHCPFSRTIGQRILEAGHWQVKIFPGGWSAWQASQ